MIKAIYDVINWYGNCPITDKNPKEEECKNCPLKDGCGNMAG